MITEVKVHKFERTTRVKDKFLRPQWFLRLFDRTFKVRNGLTLEEAAKRLVLNVVEKNIYDEYSRKIPTEEDKLIIRISEATPCSDPISTSTMEIPNIKSWIEKKTKEIKAVKNLLIAAGFKRGKISVGALIFNLLSDEALKNLPNQESNLADLIRKRWEYDRHEERLSGEGEYLQLKIKETLRAIVGRIGNPLQVLEWK